MNRYKITCLKCKKSDLVSIDNDNKIIFESGAGTNFLAGRYRKDMNFGWECICGNDNRIALSEKEHFNQLVAGTPQQIEEIKQSLKIDDKKQFVMKGV